LPIQNTGLQIYGLSLGNNDFELRNYEFNSQFKLSSNTIDLLLVSANKEVLNVILADA